jgi:hypothetical protein
MDEVVFAGLAVVLGTMVFFGGFVYFIYQDNKKTKKKNNQKG